MQAEAKLSPFFLLIFILKELFELLRVLHVGAAVSLWVKHTQPRPSAHLKTHIFQEVTLKPRRLGSIHEKQKQKEG